MRNSTVCHLCLLMLFFPNKKTNNMKKIGTLLCFLASANVFAQPSKEDIIAGILNNTFDNNLTILGNDGVDTLRLSTLRTKILIIKNNTYIINPRGNQYAVVIN